MPQPNRHAGTADAGQGTGSVFSGNRITELAAAAAVTTMLLLLFSMAVYTRERTGWHSPGEFDVDIYHMAFGLPHWLVVNRVHAEGTPPAIYPPFLPEAEKYAPGWHVRPLRLLASLALCVLAALPLAVLYNRLRPGPGVWPYAIVCVPAALTGTFSHLLFAWEADPIALAVQGVCLIVTAAVLRDYLRSAGAATGMVAVLWWTHRVADLFREKQLVYGPPDANELVQYALLWAAALVIASTATAASRFVQRRRS